MESVFETWNLNDQTSAALNEFLNFKIIFKIDIIARKSKQKAQKRFLIHILSEKYNVESTNLVLYKQNSDIKH